MAPTRAPAPRPPRHRTTSRPLIPPVPRAPRRRLRDLVWFVTSAVAFIAAAALAFAYLARPTARPSSEKVTNQTASCTPASLADNISRADLIITGRVAAVLPGSPYAIVHVEALRRYRGQLPGGDVLIVANPTDNGPMGTAARGDLHFTSNDPPYLLFLKQRGDGRFDTSRCTGSRLLGEGLSTDEQSVLGSGEAP